MDHGEADDRDHQNSRQPIDVRGTSLRYGRLVRAIAHHKGPQQRQKKGNGQQLQAGIGHKARAGAAAERQTRGQREDRDREGNPMT